MANGESQEVSCNLTGQTCLRFMDVELQQRAVEYMSLERRPELARSNVVAMPPWEKRKSLLLRRMAAREVRAAPRKRLPLRL